MPAREPLSAPLLSVSATLGAVVGGWLAYMVHAVCRGAFGAVSGFPWHGIDFTGLGVPVAAQGTATDAGPGLWALMLLSGPVGGAALAAAAQYGVELVRSPAWLRVVAFEWMGFALLRVPVLMAAAGLRGGRGEFAELYRRLGEPDSGRWAVTLLALVALWGLAWVVARRAVAVGRSWMRVDGVEFRRRLVRVLGGYPLVAALALFSIAVPWAPLGWELVWLGTTFAVLAVRVS